MTKKILINFKLFCFKHNVPHFMYKASFKSYVINNVLFSNGNLAANKVNTHVKFITKCDIYI